MSIDPRPDTVPPAEVEALIDRLPRLENDQAPAPYPHDDEEAHDGQDDLDELGAPGDAPNAPAEAIRLARRWVAERLWVGVGYCLRTVRSLYGVAALYPDAETAWERAERRHRTDNPADIPWGVPVWWVNGRYGHVALSLGRGRCLTTDYVATGRLGVAPIAALAPWCGGRLVGWTNDLNGVDVWEPKPRPKPWGIEDRAALIRHALRNAVANEAPARRIKGLRKWLHNVEARIERERDK